MVSDDDKAQLGTRMNGEQDPQDPDGLLTLDDLSEEERTGGDDARGKPRAPGSHEPPHEAIPRDQTPSSHRGTPE